MKSRLLFLTFLALGTAFFAFGIRESVRLKKSGLRVDHTKKTIIRCGPDWESLNEWLEENEIPPIPGAGSYKWKITTRSDSAQFYFNQGINMYYSFHIIEAMSSFKKAAKFEPSSAMVHWAQALAYGPNINDVGYAASPEALLAVGKAVELMGRASEKEKLLIKAQQTRYSPDSTETREKLNQLYVDNMKLVYDKYPNDPDVAALYADALMLQHPWDLWKIDGTPQPWTPGIRQVLEKLLKHTPGHPGANHYYIHVMEPSPFAALALPSADRLGKLTPALAHTVHMPSHIYLRTGHYEKGMSVNESAVNSYKKLIPVYEPVTTNPFLYIIHNLHMQTNHALMAGKSGYASWSARETDNSIPPDYLQIPGALGNVVQYIHMTPTLTDIRFGNWDKLFQYPQPDKSQVYSNVLYHFGRGMALTHKARTAEARHELETVRQLMKDTTLKLPFTPFSAAIEGAIVAENILAGTILLKEKDYENAITHFTRAVATEDKMVYNEPRDWLLNPKHYLGNAFLKAGKPVEARKVLEKDLENNKENGWALFGMWQALVAEKKTAEAGKMLQRFKKAFDKADIILNGPVF